MAETLSQPGPAAAGGERQAFKVPPHSIQAEQAVLGGLMLDNSAWDQVADRVGEQDFYRKDHRLIFRAIAHLADEGKPFDAVTLGEWLEKHGQLEAAGGLAHLGTLAKNTPTAANIRAYADIVREHSVLRQLVRVGTDIADSAYFPEGRSSADLLDQAEQRVFQIAEQGDRGRGGFAPIKELLTKAVDRIDTLFQADSPVTGVPTGFHDIDEMTAGLQHGDLIIVAGRPSMGKTSFAMNMAEHAAIKHKVPVAVFSMEMPGEQLAMRLMSSLGHIDQHKVRTGKLDDDDWPRLTSAVSILADAPLFIDDTPALTPTELRARARRLKREHDLGLIVIDYLQLMQVPGTRENRATEISEISRSLKALAKELDVPVVALSQLNRSLEQRPNKRPVMSDLRECVTGDTLVVLADGRRVPIESLVGQMPEVVAVDESQRLTTARAEMVWKVGRRPVYEVRLASGRRVRTTAEHRLLSGGGWRTVKNLRVGDRVALARRLPGPEVADSWSEPRLALLGHLIGNGSYLTDQPLRYTTASEENSALMRGTSDGGGSHVRFSPSRQVLAGNASLLGDDGLACTAGSDLYWDRVVSIEAAGEAEVYDLTVPGPACWLADGIVSHNSGAIEQDADMIVFIYRDEVYDEDSPDKGTAEIIIGKQRNGPIGMRRLTFLGQYTRFENFAADSYSAEDY